MADIPDLARRVRARDARAVARAISWIEDEASGAGALVSALYPHGGRAYVVGVTGAPGAGKSTLVDGLVAEYRREGLAVAVLAVDPTSPYTGGAMLGDRVRMQRHAGDDGVFIRSMATRGHLGGLARATAEAVVVLDAAGFDRIVIETVGVGQDEVDIVRTADVAVVVLVPGAGDDVQTLKAGLMEIADVFVVNKADRDGADRTVASIEAMLSLARHDPGDWRPPVLRTEATSGRGVADVAASLERFGRDVAGGAARARRRTRADWHLRQLLAGRFMRYLEEQVLAPGELQHRLDAIERREADPYHVSEEMLARAVAPPGSLDHVGVAVQDASALVALFARVFGFETSEPETVGAHRVRFVRTGDTTVELVEPVTPEAVAAKFLDGRATALHHICLQVPDIEAALAALKAKGIALVDEVPRVGAHGARIAFLHPASTCGLLIEIKQP